MRVIAIDPGKTTGWAYWNTKNPADGLGTQAGQMEWFEFLCAYEEWLNAGYIDVTVIENFIITKNTLKKGRQNQSLEGIGAVRFLNGKKGVPMVLQPPSDMAFSTNDKLKKVGWWPKGEVHAQDAYRHLLKYAVDHSTEMGFDLTRIM